jgi:hypothetical protein
MRVLTTRLAPHGAATARDELRLCLPWPRTGSMEHVERMTAFCLLADLTHGTNGRPLLADPRQSAIGCSRPILLKNSVPWEIHEKVATECPSHANSEVADLGKTKTTRLRQATFCAPRLFQHNRP